MLSITISIDCQAESMTLCRKYSFTLGIFLRVFNPAQKSKRERCNRFTRSRFVYTDTHTRMRARTCESKPRSFIAKPVGGQAAAAKRKGCTERGGRQRSTVVFHSHYRNVLPCALVAPRNKSSVTVTMDVGVGMVRERDEHEGVIVAPQPASMPVR